MADDSKPTIIKDFPGRYVDWHLKTYGRLPPNSGTIATVGVVTTQTRDGTKTGVVDICKDCDTNEVVIRCNHLGDEIVLRLSEKEAWDVADTLYLATK